MKQVTNARLSRRFQRILATCMPLPGIALLACGGSAIESGDGAPALEGGASGSSSGGSSGGSSGSGGSSSGGDAAPAGADAGADASAGDGGSSSDAGQADGDATFVVTSCGDTVPVTGGPFGGCYAQCFPVEAGAFDGGDGGPFSAACATLCPSPGAWFSCAPETDGGALLIRCQPNCTGRRPGGLLASRPAAGAPLGVYFAEMARLEAASVAAFRHLRRELVALGAPRRLVRAAERAARDEVRHARTTSALARRHGVTPIAPRVEAVPVRSLEAMALENAAEGCVREALGALVASWQARTARDPVVRAAMERIARDETRHAALAFAVDAWARGRLDAEARRRLERATMDAIAEVVANTRRDDTPVVLRAPLGLPTGGQTRALAESLFSLAA